MIPRHRCHLSAINTFDMRNIHDYSEKELKKLHGEFKKLKTYEDKVAFVYSHFGRVFGHINQDGAGPDFSIKPKDEKENEIRWMHFFNARKEEVLQKLMADYRDRYEKAPDEAVFIEASLLEVRKIYESNSNLMYGYEMGSLAKGLDWIHWDQFYMDWTGTLEPYYEGWAYYRLEQWLIGLKEDYSFDEDWVRKDEHIKVPVLVALILRTGIIEHLSKEFPRLNGHKANLSKLLSILCQVDAKDRVNFLKTLTNAMNKADKFTPNTEKVTSILLDVKAIDPPSENQMIRKKKGKTG
jgi:hypothetical protein